MPGVNTVQELVRTSSMLTRTTNRKTLISTLVEQALDVSESDLAVMYGQKEDSDDTNYYAVYKRGPFEHPQKLPKKTEFIEFLRDSKETLVINDKKPKFFKDIFLNEQMKSAIAIPLFTPKLFIGIVVLNNREEEFYGYSRLSFLDSYAKMASGMIHNGELFKELQARLNEIETLQRYQESIFSSMTNLLVTTDKKGNIHYFNKAAEERLGLRENHLGLSFSEHFKKSAGKRFVNQVEKTQKTGKTLMGFEGMLEFPEYELDYSLNISPLKGKASANEGLTFLFTDQSKERELKDQMEVAVEDRRVIKDMFSRYLSQDVVQSMMDSPELVKLGGDQKISTIFFADIRGYTSFSEGKDPGYIVDVLNEYFTEAVDVVIKHNGYIDKYIGDCIMAAWGVPVFSPESDAVAAVNCAVEIQDLVKSKQRKFFKGEASHLQVGIGMHTGPLVAGNLGSSQRMDYSVIGDTVNIAARLEGVSKAGDVIITQQTRDYLGEKFKLKELEPVKVKGKEKPLHIFNVLGKN
jgi:adenylate cyclase